MMWEKQLKQKFWAYNAIGIFALLAFLLGVRLLSPRLPEINCLFLLLFKLYCPGCGGTRSVLAFVSGEFFRSLCYFPPLWVAGLLILRMEIWAILSLLMHKPLFFARVRGRDLLWIAVSVVVWFLLRNALLLCGFDILQFADSLA